MRRSLTGLTGDRLHAYSVAGVRNRIGNLSVGSIPMERKIKIVIGLRSDITFKE